MLVDWREYRLQVNALQPGAADELEESVKLLTGKIFHDKHFFRKVLSQIEHLISGKTGYLEQGPQRLQEVGGSDDACGDPCVMQVPAYLSGAHVILKII